MSYIIINIKYILRVTLTENKNELGKQVAKVLNKPAPIVNLVDDQNGQQSTSQKRAVTPPNVSTPVPAAPSKARGRKRSRERKYAKKRSRRLPTRSSSDSTDRYSSSSFLSSSNYEDEYDRIQ